MQTVMLGYWVILVGIVLDILGTIWDTTDDLFVEEAFGGLLTPERLKFLGMVVVILGLVLGSRLGLRCRRRSVRVLGRGGANGRRTAASTP